MRSTVWTQQSTANAMPATSESGRIDVANQNQPPETEANNNAIYVPIEYPSTAAAAMKAAVIAGEGGPTVKRDRQTSTGVESNGPTSSEPESAEGYDLDDESQSFLKHEEEDLDDNDEVVDDDDDGDQSMFLHHQHNNKIDSLRSSTTTTAVVAPSMVNNTTNDDNDENNTINANIVIGSSSVDWNNCTTATNEAAAASTSTTSSTSTTESSYLQ